MPSWLDSDNKPGPDLPTSGLESELFQTRLNLAEAAFKGGDNRTATEIYKRLLEDYPDQPEILLPLADTLVMSGDLISAESLYLDLERQDYEKKEAPYIGLGRIALKRLEPKIAQVHFQAAIQNAPDSYAALNGYAVALDMDGKHVDARNIYLHLIHIDPMRQEAHLNYGLSLIAQGKYQEAIDLLLQIVRSDLDSTVARHNMALAYALMNDEASAKEILLLDLRETQLLENLCFYRTIRSPGQATYCPKLLSYGSNIKK
ncbi:tetratricopeptide repeat protein [Aestuariispira insulae]|nr:tetratricopeptide repeat protein [Aestuariispira insulae]